MKGGSCEMCRPVRLVLMVQLSFPFAIWVETVAARMEREAAAEHQGEERRAEEAFISGDHARELCRLVEKLSEDSSELRCWLLHSKVPEIDAGVSRKPRAAALAFEDLCSKAS